MASMAISDISTTVGKYGRDFAPVTFAAGFVYGATNDIAYTGGTQPGVTIQRVSDTIARVTGLQVNLGAGSVQSTQTRTLNIGNVLNNGTFAAVGLELAHNVTSNKWVKLAKDVFAPPLWGYGVGKMFDDTFPTGNYMPSGQATLAAGPYRFSSANTVGWQGTGLAQGQFGV